MSAGLNTDGAEDESSFVAFRGNLYSRA